MAGVETGEQEAETLEDKVAVPILGRNHKLMLHRFKRQTVQAEVKVNSGDPDWTSLWMIRYKSCYVSLKHQGTIMKNIG